MQSHPAAPASAPCLRRPATCPGRRCACTRVSGPLGCRGSLAKQGGGCGRHAPARRPPPGATLASGCCCPRERRTAGRRRCWPPPPTGPHSWPPGSGTAPWQTAQHAARACGGVAILAGRRVRRVGTWHPPHPSAGPSSGPILRRAPGACVWQQRAAPRLCSPAGLGVWPPPGWPRPPL